MVPIRLLAVGAAGALLMLPGMVGCQRQPAPFKATADPGETIYFVPVREKIVALTFDDGPNEPATGQILTELRRYQVKATFFLIGANVEHFPETARRIQAEGHLIGSHTARHSRFDQSAPSDIARDIADGCRIIETVTGLRPIWFRPPYGINPNMAEAAQAQGLAIAGWSADANDWNPHPVEELVERMVSQATPGDILLLHDGRETEHGVNRQATVAAVPLILEKLIAQGFRFVTIPELLRFAGRPVAEFEGGLRLLGLQIPTKSVAPGEGFWVRYFWDAPGGWRNDLKPHAFVHWTTADGAIRFQDDHEIPRRGDVRDLVLKHLVIVPQAAPSGRYQARLGLFDPRKPDIRHRVRVRSVLQQQQGAIIIPDVLDVQRLPQP
ncbi:MAG: polysaccharide deacetylase family protein [Lentisphaerae bacterium]|nr:polysaccharide deacetylase family protein [Lentisphaerota bacterium]